MESGNSLPSNTSFGIRFSQSSPPPPPPPPPHVDAFSLNKVSKKYDVFLSFTGKDTRFGFTDHLYAALCRVGIYTFKDDTKLEKGKPFPKELIQAIKHSSCSVIVLSENYAFSRWCLKELAQIMKCMKNRGQVVLPIFYHVNISDVRYQKGSYRTALLKHRKHCSSTTLKRWKNALRDVANLNGDCLGNHCSYEAEFVKKFVQHISEKVLRPFPYILNESQYKSKGLFGIERRIRDLNSYVRIEEDDCVRIIGICGMGGIGKTEIARAYYDFMYSQFEGASFLYNVGKVYQNKGNLVCIQKQLFSQCTQTEEGSSIFNTGEGNYLQWRMLCSRKVLVVLDGVDQLEQIQELAPNCKQFGPGSRILITTRDENLLAKHEVTVVYKVEPLNGKEALQLFCFHAFEQPHEPNYSRKYTELCKEVLTYANGLPLALRVLGILLKDQKTIIERTSYWRKELDRLKEYPSNDIIDVLEMGFDKGLVETEKEIFLDIACFFKGQKKDFITKVMDCCGFHPEAYTGITSLVGKSLLTIRDGEIWMHDLLQEMGRDIVKRKSRRDPREWSRLWSYEDVCDVLKYYNYQEKETVEASEIFTNNIIEAICFYYPSGKECVLGLEALSNFKKLRLLCINGPGSSANVLSSTTSSKIHFNHLRFMKWEGYPFHLLPSGFRSNGLVELHLESSRIVELFDNQKMEPMHNLKIINLSHSKSLNQIQHLQQVAPNLEKLLLSFCDKLKKIDESITYLKRLTLLDVRCCYSLIFLPSNMKFLKVLNLEYCLSLRRSTEFYVDRLEELYMSEISGENFVHWAFGGTKNLFSSHSLNFLKTLELRSCFLFDNSFPADSFCCFSSLEYLDLSNNKFNRLPQGISRLIKLRYLHLDDCTHLELLGDLPPSLELLTTIDCNNLQDPIFITQSNLRCLAALFLDCLSLVDECGGVETMLLTSLKRHVQNSLTSNKRFDIVIPGRTIPEWFIHRNQNRDTSSVFMDLHQNWSNKWMGFVLCLMYDAGGNGGLVGFQGQVKINGSDSGLGPINIPYTHFLSQMTNDWYQGKYDNEISFHCREQVWMIYLPRIYFQPNWQLDENSCRIEFQFHGHCIISSGVRLLYEEDI